MAETNQQVLDTVRQELQKSPNRGSKELYEIAIGAEPSIAEHTLQQFHARYVLPIKREQAAAKGGGQKKPAKRKPRSRAAAAAPAPAAESKQPASRGRKSAAAEAKGPQQQQRRKRRGGPDREQVRSLFLQFAREFANAESRGEIVEVLSSVDRYVDQLVDRS
jgi:hypothetical protein